MAHAAVRRVNEWDGPAMLKIYGEFTGTCAAPEKEPPALSDYIMRIDKYTYGLGWIMCEIDSAPAGFCHLTENRDDPKNLFSVELQLYVSKSFQRRGVGAALWSLIRDIMELGSRRTVTVRINSENTAATDFFTAMGFECLGVVDGELLMRYQLTPAEENPDRPTKPYLIENLDYEHAREKAARLVRV